jgi:hypothetical protein
MRFEAASAPLGDETQVISVAGELDRAVLERTHRRVDRSGGRLAVVADGGGERRWP